MTDFQDEYNILEENDNQKHDNWFGRICDSIDNQIRDKLYLIESNLSSIDRIYWYVLGWIVSAMITFILNYMNFKAEGEINFIWKYSTTVSSVMFVALYNMCQNFIISLEISVITSFDLLLTAPTFESFSRWPMTHISIICVLFISKINQDENHLVNLLILLLPPIAYLILNQTLVGYSCLLPFGYATIKFLRFILKKLVNDVFQQSFKVIMVILSYFFMYLISYLIHLASDEENDLESCSIAEIIVEAQLHCPGILAFILISLLTSGLYVKNSFVWLALILIYVPRSYNGNTKTETVYKEVEIALLFAAAKSISRIHKDEFAKIFLIVIGFYLSYQSFIGVDVLGISNIIIE